MKRTEFEHAIRAAASILGTDGLMVIANQALHATINDELHDLWISKAIASRDKDIELCQALLSAGIVDKAVLRSRLDAVTGLATGLRQMVGRRIDERWREIRPGVAKRTADRIPDAVPASNLLFFQPPAFEALRAAVL